MRRHATTMIAAVLCLLLFSGRLAAAEKSFGGGGGGGYGGLEAGGGQQPQAEATATPQPEVGGGAGGYSTRSEATPYTPAAEETTTTPAGASSGGEAAAAASGGEASAGGGGYSTPSEAAPSTPAAEETTPAASSGGGGGYGAPAGKAGGGLDPDGDPEVGLNEKAINEIVDEHNLFRAKENAGLPPLVWNATLAKFSQQYAETLKGNCQQIHSSSPYGENLMEGTPGLTWKITVDGWSEEKKNYHYDTDACDAGKMCGHYKAVVWKTTTSVGCGRIKCNSGDTIIMCSYWPPGNYDGVKPY
ncbi:unnamed protein product [Miscanthus lutarioriparius]|uniref:SCP domain-containing protein n=1 Tax=Miscanthus lutarioriparius TaxID=422564 RepID=A0A811R9N2_9POAL|nr:unnamed protein product [Miscanthus lutarioriparius]